MRVEEHISRNSVLRTVYIGKEIQLTNNTERSYWHAQSWGKYKWSFSVFIELMNIIIMTCIQWNIWSFDTDKLSINARFLKDSFGISSFWNHSKGNILSSKKKICSCFSLFAFLLLREYVYQIFYHVLSYCISNAVFAVAWKLWEKIPLQIIYVKEKKCKRNKTDNSLYWHEQK